MAYKCPSARIPAPGVIKLTPFLVAHINYYVYAGSVILGKCTGLSIIIFFIFITDTINGEIEFIGVGLAGFVFGVCFGVGLFYICMRRQKKSSNR